MITEEMKEMTRRFVEALNPEQVILFGSYARDDYNKNSDYDFYIIMPDENPEHWYDLTVKAYRSIREIKKTPVDIILDKRGHFDFIKKYPTIERKVAREGVILYDSNN